MTNTDCQTTQHPATTGRPKEVCVTGSTGLIGSHLIVELLKTTDYQITALTRGEVSETKLTEILARHGYSPDGFLVNETNAATRADIRRSLASHADAGDCRHDDASHDGSGHIDSSGGGSNNGSGVRVTYRRIDTEDYAGLKEVIADYDIVFHCAAIVSFESGSAEQIVSNNVELANYVVDSCLASPRDPLLVHISSIAALGTETYPTLTTEHTAYTNIAEASAYSRSKFLSENEVWRGVKMGLRAVVVNPSVVLGVGARGSEGLQPIFRMAEGGISIYTEAIEGFVDVVDVARAMRMLAEQPDCWGRKYILSGENINFRRLITVLNGVFGRRPPRYRIGRRTLKTAAWLLSLVQRKPLITKEMISFLTGRAAYDGESIRRSLPQFAYTPFEQTAQRIASETKDQKRLTTPQQSTQTRQ